MTNLGTFGPLLSGVEVLWKFTNEHEVIITLWNLVHPVFVDDCTESHSNVRGLGFEESVVISSVPSSFHRVNSSNVLVMIDNEIFEIVNAHVDFGTDLFFRDIVR